MERYFEGPVRPISDVTLLFFYQGTLNHSSAYIKRSLFDKYGLYDESLKVVSDWKFYLITVGLNDEPIAHKDIDVVLFDMKGISNTNPKIDKEERKRVLKNLLPNTILNDYENFGTDSRMIKRLKKIN